MKVVVVTSRFPFPIEKGDKLRAYHHIKALAEHHEVYLAAISHHDILQEDIDSLKEYCVDIQVYRINKIKLYFNIIRAFLTGVPIMIGYFHDQAAKKKMQNDILNIDPDHVYAQLIRTSEYVRALPFKKTLDYMDVFSIGMEQRSKSSFWPLSLFYRYESYLLSKYEKMVYPDFDHHSIISLQDRNRLQIGFTDNICVLPNGVDTQYYAPSLKDPKYDLVFVGNMGYLPNIEAAEFLVQQVLPRLKKDIPEVTVLIAGARPSPRVKQLESKHVYITGWIKDIRSAYANGKIFIAPIFSGMGQQNKILEAMSMGRACITSAMVNNAIGGVHNQNIMIADDAEKMAAMIIELLSNETRRNEMGVAARTFISDNYEWAQQNRKLNALVQKTSFLETVKG